ncbi:MAG: dihydrodipicolinate synthase family protein, partial [Mesorhizobium sp.]
MLNPKGAVIWWHTIRTDAATAGEAVTRMQAFLATHVLPFRAYYACYNVSDAALDKAMAAAGGWAPLGPRLLWLYS